MDTWLWVCICIVAFCAGYFVSDLGINRSLIDAQRKLICHYRKQLGYVPYDLSVLHGAGKDQLLAALLQEKNATMDVPHLPQRQGEP